jgi:eukaryotic-like serine/threonine-protein kinase
MHDTLGALREGLAPHYAVERQIGAGGMARVYLAHERHPARKVAVKVMNPELSTADFRERFIREVELTSKLNHPHIVPILAADECLFVPDGPDGLCYYIMPYIEGESLRVRLSREKTLPLPEALRITFQVADALSYAHGHGIIHRDVKPENILLSESHAVVADFGIARAVSAAAGGTLTAGRPVGSLAYMSPEQLAGSRAIDARTDVYSLGCVLYEMLVGTPPLLDLAEGSAPTRSSLETMLRSRGVSRRTTRDVKEALSRALASSPADRFHSVEELVTSLRESRGGRGRWWPRIDRKAALLGAAAVIVIAAAEFALLAGRRPALDPRRVVVAGFEDLSGDPALAPLSHLAADWVTQGLAQRGTVEVVPAAESGHLDAAGVQALAGRTGAGTVISGSYFKDGDSVRFQLLIIDAARGTVRRAVEPVSVPASTPLQAAAIVRRRVTALFDTLFLPLTPSRPDSYSTRSSRGFGR